MADRAVRAARTWPSLPNVKFASSTSECGDAFTRENLVKPFNPAKSQKKTMTDAFPQWI
jgi:hypothetical protein